MTGGNPCFAIAQGPWQSVQGRVKAPGVFAEQVLGSSVAVGGASNVRVCGETTVYDAHSANPPGRRPVC